MKPTFSAMIITVAALTLVTFPARRGTADDESKDIQIEIEAPLDAKDCTATPPTITVLGLNIDISNAIDAVAPPSATPAPTPATAVDDGGRRGQGGTTTPPTTNCYYNFCSPAAVPTPTGCAALSVGQTVEVKLASDHAPLAATEVKQDASTAHNIALQAPLQNFDATAETITVLGLTIDVSGAGLEGADDDSNDGHSQPIDLHHLLAGQSIETTLVSSAAPLVAAAVEVKNFTNQLRVAVTDADGNPVGDVDINGNPVNDVDVDVVQTVPVQSATPGTTTTKVLHFHAGSNGRVTLSGLATTRARIYVTRVHNGVTLVSRHIVRVRANTARSLHVRLRPASAR